MMAETSGANVTVRTGPQIAGPVCCSPSSQTTTPLIEQKTTESCTVLAALQRHGTDAIIRVLDMSRLTVLHEGQYRFRPSRAALCTFLL
jgi:hypothetical protein